MKHPNINILFLDEIFASLDIEGTYDILHILQNFIKKLEINAFVISFNMLPVEKFDKVIKVEKNANESKLFIMENE
jgi:ABC-type Mn2+/Zn2+ transport system ATPase subunit